MKRTQSMYAGMALIIAGLLYVMIVSLGDDAGTGSPEADQGTVEEMQAVSSGSTGQGDVSIMLKPKQITPESLVVEFSAATHSVDLSRFDLKKITTLEADGAVMLPSSAPLLRGHHVSGDLVFAATRKMEGFTIKIKGIPQVEERVFAWR